MRKLKFIMILFIYLMVLLTAGCSKKNESNETTDHNHIYENWVVLEEATKTKKGIEEGTCVICNQTIRIETYYNDLREVYDTYEREKYFTLKSNRWNPKKEPSSWDSYTKYYMLSDETALMFQDNELRATFNLENDEMKDVVIKQYYHISDPTLTEGKKMIEPPPSMLVSCYFFPVEEFSSEISFVLLNEEAILNDVSRTLKFGLYAKNQLVGLVLYTATKNEINYCLSHLKSSLTNNYEERNHRHVCKNMEVIEEATKNKKGYMEGRCDICNKTFQQDLYYGEIEETNNYYNREESFVLKSNGVFSNDLPSFWDNNTKYYSLKDDNPLVLSPSDIEVYYNLENGEMKDAVIKQSYYLEDRVMGTSVDEYFDNYRSIYVCAYFFPVDELSYNITYKLVNKEAIIHEEEKEARFEIYHENQLVGVVIFSSSIEDYYYHSYDYLGDNLIREK